jgi:16S rRNA processing protein RimM
LSSAPGDRLEVGRVVKPHGIQGEVVVVATTNRTERFAAGNRLWVDGVRTAAEGLRGAVLTAEPLDEAPDGEVWVHDIVGAEVVDRAGAPIGVVTAVEANPAHDLLVLEGGTLVPMVFVVDQQPGRVVVDVPDGLLDL